MAERQKSGGRAKGTPNKVNQAARLRISQEADPVGFFIRIANGEPFKAALPLPDETKRTALVEIYPTLDQRMQAHRFLLNKQIPDAKSAPVRLDLPAIEGADGVLKGLAAVIDSMAKGDLTPDEATAITGVLDAKRLAIETTDHESRIRELERQKERAK
jgi:hypothetical protein